MAINMKKNLAPSVFTGLLMKAFLSFRFSRFKKKKLMIPNFDEGTGKCIYHGSINYGFSGGEYGNIIKNIKCACPLILQCHIQDFNSKKTIMDVH